MKLVRIVEILITIGLVAIAATVNYCVRDNELKLGIGGCCWSVLSFALSVAFGIALHRLNSF